MRSLETGSGPEVVTVPHPLSGLSVGVVASQLRCGAVRCGDRVRGPDQGSGEVGGLCWGSMWSPGFAIVAA